MATSRVFSIQQYRYLAFLLSDSCEKCGVSGSVVDPDSDPDPGGEKLPKKSEKITVHVLKCWMFSFDG
jgi:hypothetical protein